MSNGLNYVRWGNILLPVVHIKYIGYNIWNFSFLESFAFILPLFVSCSPTVGVSPSSTWGSSQVCKRSARRLWPFVLC